jgi:MOSC domain-containing protein
MATAITHRTLQELEAGLEEVRQSPRDSGVVKLIVRRPGVNQREVLDEGVLDVVEGLVGDTWGRRPSSRSRDGSAHPDMQLNIINARAIALIAPSPEHWALAGDQLYLDLDLSDDNLPPGTRLALGSAVIEVTEQPHTGCSKFTSRFGADATKFVNSTDGKRLHLRGVNAKVVQAGVTRVGDIVRKV